MEAAAVTDLSSEKLKGEMWQQRKVHGNEGSARSFMEKDLVSGPESSHVEYSGLKEREDGGALDDGSRVGRGERVASFSSVIPGINGKTESLREEIEELKAQLEKLRQAQMGFHGASVLEGIKVVECGREGRGDPARVDSLKASASHSPRVESGSFLASEMTGMQSDVSVNLSPTRGVLGGARKRLRRSY